MTNSIFAVKLEANWNAVTHKGKPLEGSKKEASLSINQDFLAEETFARVIDLIPEGYVEGELTLNIENTCYTGYWKSVSDLVCEPSKRAYVVKLTRREGESEFESCYLVTGDQNLTEAMVSSVGLNFVTNCDCLLPDSEAGDDVYTDGNSLFWVNQITELEPSEIEVVSKYMLTQEYEVLLQGGKLPDAKH